ISDYACYANNPIFFSDPFGDTVKVKYGFLRLRSAQYNEQDQKFYDKKGNVVDTDNKFFNAVENSFATLNSGSNGKQLLDDLSKNENLIKIRRGGYLSSPGYGNKWRVQGGYFNRNKATRGEKLGGTMIIQMRTNEQMFTDIAHEGGHGWA